MLFLIKKSLCETNKILFFDQNKSVDRIVQFYGLIYFIAPIKITQAHKKLVCILDYTYFGSLNTNLNAENLHPPG